MRTLRGSFAVLPARRPLVTAGPYALVRHPMYAGELLMVGGCALAAGGVVGIGLACLALATLTARVLVEEQVLADDPVVGASLAVSAGRRGGGWRDVDSRPLRRWTGGATRA